MSLTISLNKLLRYSSYNKDWPIEYSKIESFLKHILTGLHKEIHHVGSTSVKGLGSKPILDIDIEYTETIEPIINVLTSNGWEYQGDKGIEGRHAFRRTDDAFYEHHLYAIHSSNPELKKHLDFRNALRTYKIFRLKYQTLKQNLIIKNNKDRLLYTNSKTDLVHHIMKVSGNMNKIVFAGGCFWGVEAYFKQLTGVYKTEAGYIAGNGETTYQEVCSGSGHAEAVLIEYNNEEIELNKLLDHLFNIIDPTSINKQGPDIGVQYRSGIYNYNDSELEIINTYFNKKQPQYKRPIAIELKTELPFFSAEEYHQDYLDKNKNGYCHVNLDSHKNV